MKAQNRDQSPITHNHSPPPPSFPRKRESMGLASHRNSSDLSPQFPIAQSYPAHHTNHSKPQHHAPLGSEVTRLIETAALERALEEFAQARDWEQFHSPKNLAMALTGEAGGLVELSQWLTKVQSLDAIKDPTKVQRIREEMAVVMLYLVRLASVPGVDMNKAVRGALKVTLEAHTIGQRSRRSARA